MPLTVSEITEVTGLEALKLRAGTKGLNNNVRWPYVAENREVAPWLLGGELIFVTGINLKRDIADYRQLIIEAQQHHAAGMVILTGSEFIKTIPEPVLAFAEQRGFPLFEQPYCLPMVKVTELICNRIIQADLAEHSLRWFLNQVIESPRILPAFALQRAANLKLNIEQPLMVALIVPISTEKIDLNFWTFTLNRLLAPYQRTLPIVEYQDGWYLFLDNQMGLNHEQQTQRWNKIVASLNSAGLPCFVGVSDTSKGIIQLGLAAQQAKQAALFARNSACRTVLHYSVLGINKIFIAVDNQDLLTDFCRQQLGSLFANKAPQAMQLKHTLAVYFENLCCARKTAKSLAIHRNTLQHRLQKFESLSHSQLNIAQQRLSIQNALMMESLILDENNYYGK
ncbi:MAG: sugar diacid utilization regulator [Psychromonas sp.]|jgi:sugar diacid utilization regulator|uniref:PucR family transcriptional regulator n=1 Tax=Psychromonas sp. TaxID=1884585 RepID=UPI0039E60243